MLILLVIVVVAAAATYVLTRPDNPTDLPDIPGAPDAPISPTLPPEGTVEAGPLEQVEVIEEDTQTEEVSEEETTEQEEKTEDPEEPEMNSTAANDGMTDGINEAYFAKKEYKASGNETADNSPYRYPFKNTQDFSSKTRATVAGEIVTIIRDELAARKEFAKVAVIEAALTEPSYIGKNNADDGNGATVEFEIYKMTPEYVKTDNAPLESDLYVFAKTTNLDEKEITITIQEKEEVLVAADAPLPVLERDDTSEEVQKTEDLTEITELKATIDEGFVAIPIRLRPKSDETLEEWRDKLVKGIQEDFHRYEVGNTFTVESDLSKIASNIQTISNRDLAPDHKVYTEDIESLLVEGQTYATGQPFIIPKYKKEKFIEKLWLKASAQGDDELHEKEFLNEGEESYFRIEDCIKLIWGNKINCEERKKVLEVSENLSLGNGDKILGANWLMAVMALETGESFDPAQPNGIGYFGLIQFGDAAAQDLGTTTRELAQMTFVEQMDYVEAYFRRYQSRLTSLVDVYLSVLYPSASGNGNNPNYVVFDAASSSRYNARAYRQNPSFHHESTDSVESTTGKTYIWEVDREIQEFFTRGADFINECDCNGTWHDPVDNPMLCLYTQNGNLRPRYNVFGRVRIERSSSSHQGVDLLALPGANTYACLKGEVVRAGNSGGGYGNVVTIKVSNPEELTSRRRTFTLEYADEGEILEGPGFNESGDLYIFYAHLQTVSVEVGDDVEPGDIIGLIGTSGFGSTKDPHLHFEILNAARAAGLNNRAHPGLYCYYKGDNDLSQAERDEQERIAQTYWN